MNRSRASSPRVSPRANALKRAHHAAGLDPRAHASALKRFAQHTSRKCVVTMVLAMALALTMRRAFGAYRRALRAPVAVADDAAYETTYEAKSAIEAMREARREEVNLSWREGSMGDAARGDARRCYGATSNAATFAIYTSFSNVRARAIDDLMRNTLRYVRAHEGVRYCVRLIAHDASRSATWNAASAAMEHALCAGARTKWAMFIAPDVVIDDFTVSPAELLRRVERAVGEEVFASRVLFFTGDEVGAAKLGAALMRIDDRSIAFFRRVWNDYHGIRLFSSQPKRAFERALETFRRENTVDFERDAVALPYGALSRRWNDASVTSRNSIMNDEDMHVVHDLDTVVVRVKGYGDGQVVRAAAAAANPAWRAFLVDYAGYSSRLRARDAYDRIALALRPSLAYAPMIEDPVDTYPGRVRFAEITRVQARLLRLFPTNVIVNSCGARSSELGNVLFFH